MAFEEWKIRIWAKREAAKAKMKGAHIILVGEHHFSGENTRREFHLIREASPTVLALEELDIGKAPPQDIRKVSRNLQYIEHEVKRISESHGYKFPGFETATTVDRDKHVENLLRIARKLYKIAREAKNGEGQKTLLKDANIIMTAAETLLNIDNPALYHGVRNALFYRKRPVIGIDSDRAKEIQINALKEDNMKAFKKINVQRNKIMAKNLAELVKRGHRPLAIVGAAHVEEIAKILEKEHGLKVHVVKLPNPLERAKSVDELTRRLEEIERYYRTTVRK